MKVTLPSLTPSTVRTAIGDLMHENGTPILIKANDLTLGKWYEVGIPIIKWQNAGTYRKAAECSFCGVPAIPDNSLTDYELDVDFAPGAPKCPSLLTIRPH